MARVEGYRCPITMRTTTIQPYDVPRFVSDIISQLHEIGHWTTRCCAVLNHTTPSSSTPAIISSTVTPRDARVPTTILTEMDLIKRNLNVVEKQHNTRLMSEIAYLQCALRSEAEEKMTDFERYVETKINQCVEEHTKKVRQEQMETSIALGNLQDGWRSMQSDVASLTQQLQKMQSTMEMAASRSVEMISTLHDQLKESSKLRDKHETSLGNQLSHVKLQLQESSQATKITVDQLTTRVDMARNEAKYAMDQLKLQIQQHARTLNRVAKGSNLFEMMSPVRFTVSTCCYNIYDRYLQPQTILALNVLWEMNRLGGRLHRRVSGDQCLLGLRAHRSQHMCSQRIQPTHLSLRREPPHPSHPMDHLTFKGRCATCQLPPTMPTTASMSPAMGGTTNIPQHPLRRNMLEAPPSVLTTGWSLHVM
ncbi:hypothetical protein, variant 2 [Aphanomyces astaci]|uniref:Uncharacterized protein n=1 Tax=Aphanomyces astaci TaxID=112090 RepID=W4HDF4_APHAT|nr:hypothetical protein, variant 2 [Aphanomyces astaci]ETV89344.1 hypothetical protein, variant 2 [Aphanomyces astaci]|eukprot:XP_009821744.1 hypothetical protein, variant 2 [Aphanomyces astaci]